MYESKSHDENLLVRRNVVVEGPDGSGKSTLAAYLSGALGMPLKLTEGPPKFPGEIQQRCRRYLDYQGTVFDRHPCVSQPIYAQLRNTVEIVPPALMDEFYASDPVMVFCRATNLDRHVVKIYENPEHVASVEERFHHLVKAYDAWCLDHAHVVFRIGQDMEKIVSVIGVMTQ